MRINIILPAVNLVLPGQKGTRENQDLKVSKEILAVLDQKGTEGNRAPWGLRVSLVSLVPEVHEEIPVLLGPLVIPDQEDLKVPEDMLGLREFKEYKVFGEISDRKGIPAVKDQKGRLVRKDLSEIPDPPGRLVHKEILALRDHEEFRV